MSELNMYAVERQRPAPHRISAAEPCITSFTVVADADVSLPVFSARFMGADFAPCLFEAYAVDCPVHIARSVAKRQNEFLHGRLCARRALGAIGIKGAHVSVGRMGEPVWPAGVLGSITHNHEYALAVALRRDSSVGIGIDVESIADRESCDALMALAVSPGELHYLRSMKTSLSLACLLTIVFSAKESFFKACFPTVARFLEFDAVGVETIDPVGGSVELIVNETLGGTFQPGSISKVHFRFLDAQTVLTCMHC